LEESLVVSSSKYEEIKCRFSSKRVLLYTGNLEGYQGADLMIRSYAKYLSTPEVGAESVLLIVGGTPTSIANLKNLSAECGIENRVVFDGPKPSSDMGAYMAASDFLFSPRTYGQNVPLKLYTYLASGKPLIATNISSHTQIISDDCAFLGEPNVDGFATAIREALSSTDAKKRAQAGVTLVQSKYSREDFRRRLVEAYREFLPIESPIAVTTLERSYK
jgi:glycosyltransferase involved in cell wall biosynthesis